ncbi:hypothetical protein KC19_VG274000 [Ceratodon purpureus]|uniref:Uncharacterized protein n=1 Tax=Ceratodon purpureus TaxID=3225 RepID=A0A8T0HV46_CERPU|nr:hypothetical protein KC19_VG274000 [Ceratodon purpureus]
MRGLHVKYQDRTTVGDATKEKLFTMKMFPPRVNVSLGEEGYVDAVKKKDMEEQDVVEHGEQSS